MPTKLYSLAVSHPARAAHLALEHKGVPHEVVDLLPGMHPAQLRAHGFRGGTVPALRIDGHRIQGSLEINAYLEETVAGPSLYPASEPERSAAQEAERWGEQVLQPIPRRIFRFSAVRNPAVRRWVAKNVVGMPLPGLMASVNKPIAWALGRQVGVSDERIQADLAELPALLDRVDELIADGTIGADEPNGADFQILSTVRSLMTFSDIAPLVAGRPAATHAIRLVGAMPEPLPASLPGDWLRAATADSAQSSRPLP